MSSGEKPFNVVDRRRFSNYSTTQPAGVNYVLPNGPASDDSDEAFRIACGSGPDKSREKYEPATPHVSVAENKHHQTSNDDSSLFNKVVGSIILGGLGAALIAGIALKNTNNTPRNSTPPQQIYKSAPVAQEAFHARQIPPEFREYRQARANAYKEYMNAVGPVRRVPVPPELIGMTTNPDYAGGFDLNNDGTDEIMLTTVCRDVACDNDIFQIQGAEYRKILGPTKGIKIIPKNGYAEVFSEERVGIPGHYFWNVIVKYSWDGNAYRETDRFMIPKDLEASRSTVKSLLQASQNSPDLTKKLQILENMFGIDTALHAILSSQLPSNIPLPEGDEYDRFLLQLSQDRGINYTGYSPEQLRRALFTTMISPQMLSSPEGIATVAGLSIANSIAKELGRDPYSQYMNTLRKTNGYVDNYISRTGNNPNPERLSQILAYGAAAAIREDELPTRSTPDNSTYREWSSPSGSGNSRTFNPSNAPGDPRYLNNQPRIDQNQQMRERAQQMNQATQERMRQMGNQAQKHLQNILKPPPKKK